MNITGTRTAENLLKAFAGESQAKNRYTFYAKVALGEGYVQISKIFEETARNEQEHAKVFFKHLVENGLEGQMLEIQAAYPIGLSKSTLQNLEYAANGEQEEWETLYPEFAQVAKEEGFDAIAHSFIFIAMVEKEHESRYRTLHDNIKNHTVFEKSENVVWLCDNCGYHVAGPNAPKECPACKHAQKYFQVYKQNF